MNKIEMLKQLEDKIAELELAIERGKSEDKLTGRLKRQVRPLYVIKCLVEGYPSDEIIMGATAECFTQLIDGAKGRTSYELEDGMSLANVMQNYPNLSVNKLEKKGFTIDYSKGIIVKK